VLVYDDHQQHARGIVDRQEPAAHVHTRESAALLDALGDPGKEGVAGRLADHVADQRHHVLGGSRVVAVHDHRFNAAGLGLRGHRQRGGRHHRMRGQHERESCHRIL
jgi:hypothetical protein